MAIIDAFIRHDVPLTIALITAPPNNFQGNYDCHVADVKARMTGVPTGTVNYKMELASHSVRHIDLTTMNATMQQIELVNSKQHIDTTFGTNIGLFVPPGNHWDPVVTIPLMVAAGYTSMSGQCSTGETNAASPDDMCTVNTYPTILKPFFQSIDGITHVPIGVSIADFSSGVLLSPQKLMGTETACVNLPTDQSCTIYSQVTNNARFDQAGTAGWSVVMMHPQNFGGDGVSPQTTAINTFYDAFLPMVKAQYDIYTMSDMVIVAQGGVIPGHVTGGTPLPTGSSGTTAATGAASTGSTTVAGSSGTTTVTTSTGATITTRSSSGAAMSSSSTGTGTGTLHYSGASSTYTGLFAAMVATVVAVIAV
jgi:peptidoglycan/xylan/chitin deacetylase (PgdA/CDA1 family)